MLNNPQRMKSINLPQYVTVDLTLYYCRKENRGTGHIKDLQWRPEVWTDGPKTKRAPLAYAVPHP